MTSPLHSITFLLIAIYLAGAIAVHPSVLPDAAYGLLVHKSMTAGAPWNHMTEPDPNDIARDRTYFYSIWSPGQYAIPGWLIDAGLSTGAAVAVVSIAASIAGLAGWWWLFSVLNYNRASASMACLLIAASRSFNYSFLSYVGSDVLAFAVFPFLAAALVRCREAAWLPAIAAVFIAVAFFAKNSLPIYLAAWIAALSVDRVRERGRVAIGAVAVSLLVCGAMMALIQWGYNSRGWQPLAYEPTVSKSLAVYLLPWAMPVLAATSWDDVFSRIFSHPSAPLLAFHYKQSVLLIGATAVVSAIGAVAAVRSRRDSSVRVAAVFSVVVLAAFTALLATGSGASLDLSRHYRIIGYVWLPVLLQAAMEYRHAATRWMLVLAVSAPACYGVASFAQNWRRHYLQRSSHSPDIGVMHSVATRRVVEALKVIDRDMPVQSSLVVTPSPVHALEFRRTRALATSANSDTEELVAPVPLRGRVDNLVVIAEMPAFSDRKLERWLAALQSYEAWEFVDLDNHRFFVPAGQALGLGWLQSRVAAPSTP